jgi:glyoxylase-like metal-dependent hydrolase (beta-lactamase superfamily II)
VTSDRLYFKQLLSGRDFAHTDQLARQMVNFVYLIGDRESGEAVVVDPAYGIDELVEIVGNDGLRITGVLGTHYHADHLGGSIMGYGIEGIRELTGRTDVEARVHVQRPEAEWVVRNTGVSESEIFLQEIWYVVMFVYIMLYLL